MLSVIDFKNFPLKENKKIILSAHTLILERLKDYKKGSDCALGAVHKRWYYDSTREDQMISVRWFSESSNKIRRHNYNTTEHLMGSDKFNFFGFIIE